MGKRSMRLLRAQPHKESLWLAVRFLRLNWSKGQKPLLGEGNRCLHAAPHQRHPSGLGGPWPSVCLLLSLQPLGQRQGKLEWERGPGA